MVDEDVNIWSPEDIIWSLITRVNPNTDLVRGIGGRGHAFQPGERLVAGAGTLAAYEGGLGIDATVPFESKERFTRARFAVDKFDFSRWFTAEEIRAMKAQQRDYFRWMGEVGYY